MADRPQVWDQYNLPPDAPVPPDPDYLLLRARQGGKTTESIDALNAEVARLTAENEQLRTKVDQYAKSWQIIDTENNDLRARVQAIRDLCDHLAISMHGRATLNVADVRAAIGDGDDRG